MDAVRFGRGVRALRQRRGWRQEDLAAAAAVSRAAVWRVERGRAPRLTVARLETMCAALGARLVVRLDWHGEQLDLLLDGDHAVLSEAFVARLRGGAWQWATEVTFSIYGERGAIDVLAYHPATGMLLVVEVKTVVPEVGSMLATLDRKTRLARVIARDRGWTGRGVSRLLVIREGATARRHVANLGETFGAAFPVRGVAARRWLDDPDRPISGLLFLSSARHTSGIKRVRRPAGGSTQGSGPGASRMPTKREV